MKGTAPVKRGTGCSAEIARLQRSTRLLIPRQPFKRLVLEILRKVAGERFGMQALAVHVLQGAAEAVLVAILQGAYTLSEHARRVTLMDRDLAMFWQLMGRPASPP